MFQAYSSNDKFLFWQSYYHLLTAKKKSRNPLIYKGLRGVGIIPTRGRDLHLKQFCLDDIVPAVLIVLVIHIIIAVRWMFIKILSAMIKHPVEHKIIVVGGLDVL